MKDKLKILFITNRNPYPVRDGHTCRTYNVLKGLAKKYEIYLLSLYETREEVSAKNINHLKTFCKNIELQPAPSKNFSFPMIFRLLRSIFSTSPYTIWRHYSKSYSKRIHELTNRIRFDLIHCDTLSLCYAIRKPVSSLRILTAHDVNHLKTLRIAKRTRNFLLKLFLYFEAYKLKNLESDIFKELDLVITVSEFDKKILEKVCPKGRFEIVENGVDTSMFVPANNNVATNMLLWLGGCQYYPNREAISYFLRRIYPLIKKEVVNIEFFLVGGSKIKKLKKSISRDLSIKMVGHVDNPLAYLQKANVFVVPILSGSGTRIKILEAMATGKAIVTTSIGCEGISGVNNVHYLVADTSEKFANSIISLLRDTALRQYLGDNARRLTKEKYDWEKIHKTMNHIYQSSIDARRQNEQNGLMK